MILLNNNFSQNYLSADSLAMISITPVNWSGPITEHLLFGQENKNLYNIIIITFSLYYHILVFLIIYYHYLGLYALPHKA